MLNEVKVIGNVGKVSELKEVKGKKVLNFSVAINTGKKEEQKTTWLNLSVWEKQAEALSKVLGKAKAVLVEGYLYNREAKDEDSYATTEIGVNRVQITDWKNEE